MKVGIKSHSILDDGTEICTRQLLPQLFAAISSTFGYSARKTSKNRVEEQDPYEERLIKDRVVDGQQFDAWRAFERRIHRHIIPTEEQKFSIMP